MATAARPALRLAARNPALCPSPSASTFSQARKSQLSSATRAYHHYRNAPPPRQARGGGVFAGFLTVAAALSGGAYYIYDTEIKHPPAAATEPAFQPTQKDYQDVYNAIAQLLEEKDEYDDGSYGPVLLRLAWHCSGTYDKATNTGGSNGATMRFAPEKDHGANAGLAAARTFLEPVKEAFPWITHSDLWTLGGVTAIQEMQGPPVPWRPGRSDRDIAFCTPDGRLPDGAKAQGHLRAIFHRMGFDDREIVALSGAHALGRCHADRSGFDGPWTFSPTVLGNDYYRLLLEGQWGVRKWNGPRQFQDGSKTLMMLPTDMALVEDEGFRKWVEEYAEDDKVFFRDFGEAFVKLLELGVPFRSRVEDRMRFMTREAQSE